MNVSQRIEEWFNKNSESHDSFWDMLHEWEIYDAQLWSGDDYSGGFEVGFQLALAAKGKDVHEYHNYSGDALSLYFIGDEESIIARLNDFMIRLHETYPTETEEEKRKAKLKRQKEKAEQDLRLAQMRVETLNSMLNDSPKPKIKKKKAKKKKATKKKKR